MLTKAKSESGTSSFWKSAWNDPSNEKFFSKISSHTTSAARARCIASLSWSQAIFGADPMFFWNVRRVSLPFEWALNSGNSAISLFFSLVLWIRPLTVTPRCPSLSLNSWTKSVSLKTAALSSSPLVSSKNTTGSAKDIPCMQASTPSLSLGEASLALFLLYNAQRHRLWYLASIAIMSPAASVANKAVSWSSHAHSRTFLFNCLVAYSMP